MPTERSYDLWHRALASPLGIVVKTNNPERAKLDLYAARKEANVAEFHDFSVVNSPTSPTEIWIVRKANLNAAKETS